MAFPDTDLDIVVTVYLGVDRSADPGTWTPTDLSARLMRKPITARTGRGQGQKTAQAGACTLWLSNIDGALTPLLATSTYYPDWDLGAPLQVAVDNVGSSPPYERFTGDISDITAVMVPGPGGVNVSAVKVTASGILRRLRQGARSKSALQRTIMSAASTTPTAYWRLEDGSDATRANPTVGGTPLEIAATGPTGGSSIVAPGSAAAWDFSSGGILRGSVVGVTPGATSSWEFEAVVGVSEAWSSDDIRTVLAVGAGPGTGATHFGLMASRVSGVMHWAWFAAVDGVPNFNSPLNAFSQATLGGTTHLRVRLEQDNPTPGFINMGFYIDGVLRQTVNTPYTLRQPQSVTINEGFTSYEAADIDSVSHLAIWTPVRTTADTYLAADGYAGEQAHERMERNCTEENIRFTTTATTSVALGPQPVTDVVGVLLDAEAADHGLLTESRSTWGLAYRASSQRANLDPTVTVDLSTYRTTSGTQADVLTPIRNDQRMRNEWTVRRPGGADGTYQDEVHVARFGLFDDSATINVETDSDTMHQATWLVHEGTVPGLRYADVPLDLGANPSDLLPDWLEVELGDRVDRDNHLTEHPTDLVRLAVEGYQETIRHRGWSADLNAPPYEPWDIGELADTGDTSDFVGRLAEDIPAALRAAIDSDDTSIAFDPNAYRWTMYAGLVLPGTAGNYASTPDNAALDIVGDIDLAVDVTMAAATWNTGTPTFLSKWDGAQRSYRLDLNGSGAITLSWSTTGADTVPLTSTVAVPTNSSRLAIRATLDVNNGGGGSTATFYTAPSGVSGPWTQLGAPVIGAVTSIFNSTAEGAVGGRNAGVNGLFVGTVHAAQILNGIAGTAAANPSFEDQPLGTTSFADAAGRTWTLQGTAVIDSDFPVDVRLAGEVVTVSDITTTPATFVATGTAAHANNANVTPSLPAGMAANDLMLLYAAIRNSGTGYPDTPAGYTRLRIPGDGATDNAQLFAKVHSGSESNPTVTFTGGAANADTSAQMCAFRNMPITLDDLADIVLAGQAELNASAADIAVPPLSVTPYADQVVLVLGWKQDDWTSVAPPSGCTEIGEPDTTTGSDQGITWAYRIDTTPTIVAPGSSFVVTGGGSAISRSAVVALAGGFQTMTVSARSVNGTTKSHTAGTLVEVEDALVLGL